MQLKFGGDANGESMSPAVVQMEHTTGGNDK